MGNCYEIVDMGADEAFFPNCWNCPTQCHGDADCSGYVDTADFAPFRDGFLTSYPDPVYIANVCGDFTRDGNINTADFGPYRDNFLTSPDPNCDCGGEWEPEQQKRGDSGKEDLPDEMAEWIMKNELPGWEEFLKRFGW